MRRALRLVIVLSLAIPVTSRAQDSADVARLAFLRGCWELRTPTRVTHEQWMAPLGGTLLGMSRTVVRDSTRAFEFLRITRLDGRLSYIAKPSGQAETTFGATEVSDSTVTFENPAHDFPTSISYRRAGTDSLVAQIAGPMQGTTRRVTYPMGRVSCAP